MTKIAIQMHGQTQYFSESCRTFKQQILDRFDCDVYISTFGENHIDLPQIQDVAEIEYNKENLNSLGIQQLIDDYSRHITRDFQRRWLFVRQHNVVCSMWHKMNCDRMRRQFGKIYDVIISTRPDLVYGEPLGATYVDAAKQYLLIPAGWDWEGGLNDLFALGSPTIMETFCNQFSYYIPYMKEGAITHPESLLRYHVMAQNLPLRRFSYTMYLRNYQAS